MDERSQHPFYFCYTLIERFVRGCGPKLCNLPYLLHCMDNCNKRLLTWQDTIDQTTVSARFVEKLGRPTVRENGRRVPGLKLHDLRLYRGLAAVLQFAHVITGFRSVALRSGNPTPARRKSLRRWSKKRE